MAGFDPDEYGGYEDEDDDYYAVDNAYSEADRMDRPIKLLLDVYKRYQPKDSLADRVANDEEALRWLDDYWQYVRWNEHGNQASIEEVGGFVGFAHTFDNAEYYLDYLLYDDYDKIDDDTKNLYDRLMSIAQRYGGVSKMKKSIDEDAVFNFIKNNNSCCYGEIYDYCKDIGMSDEQIDNAISNLKSEGKIDFVNQMDYVVKSIEKSEMQCPRCHDMMHDMGVHYHNGHDRRKWECFNCGYKTYGPHTERGLHRNVNKMNKSTPFIHDMIAQTRANNNSLVKNRVNLDKITR